MLSKNDNPIGHCMIHIHGLGTITAPDWETMKKYLRENPAIDPETAEWIIKTNEKTRDDLDKEINPRS